MMKFNYLIQLLLVFTLISTSCQSKGEKNLPKNKGEQIIHIGNEKNNVVLNKGKTNILLGKEMDNVLGSEDEQDIPVPEEVAKAAAETARLRAVYKTDSEAYILKLNNRFDTAFLEGNVMALDKLLATTFTYFPDDEWMVEGGDLRMYSRDQFLGLATSKPYSNFTTKNSSSRVINDDSATVDGEYEARTSLEGKDVKIRVKYSRRFVNYIGDGEGWKMASHAMEKMDTILVEN